MIPLKLLFGLQLHSFKNVFLFLKVGKLQGQCKYVYYSYLHL